MLPENLFLHACKEGHIFVIRSCLGEDDLSMQTKMKAFESSVHYTFFGKEGQRQVVELLLSHFAGLGLLEPFDMRKDDITKHTNKLFIYTTLCKYGQLSNVRAMLGQSTSLDLVNHGLRQALFNLYCNRFELNEALIDFFYEQYKLIIDIDNLENFFVTVNVLSVVRVCLLLKKLIEIETYTNRNVSSQPCLKIGLLISSIRIFKHKDM
jgi:hypothetical protein